VSEPKPVTPHRLRTMHEQGERIVTLTRGDACLARVLGDAASACCSSATRSA
jgi:hypothetical protein